MAEPIMLVTIGGILLAVGWIYLFWFRSAYCLDAYRQRLFVLRDGLFNEAAEGKLTFDSKGYQLARVRLNGLIRSAHELSLLRVVLWSLSLRFGIDHEETKQYFSRSEAFWKANLQMLPKEQGEILERIHLRALVVTAFYLLQSSLVFGPLFELVLSASRLLGLTKRLLRRVEEKFRSLQLVRHFGAKAQMLGDSDATGGLGLC